MDEGSWLSWLVIIVLLLCAMYFAMAETAFASVSRVKIKSTLGRGDVRAKKAMYVLDNIDRAITTVLIGTNVVHIVTASIVTAIVTRKWGVSYVALGTVVTTIVVFFAGEMLPKSVSKKYSEKIALDLAGSLCFFMRIFAPVSAALTAIGSAVSRFSKSEPPVTVTEDELYDIIEIMKDEGELNAGQGDLVHSALMFADVTVESVLTARVDVAAVDIDDSTEHILELIKQHRHSRLPVYKGSIDNVVGVLQIRKFIKAYIKSGGSVDIGEIMDEAYFIHHSANIDELLREMSRKKLNLAIATDNYGGTLGIVTVEDILEELVGEIWDEDDEVEDIFVRLDDGGFEIDPEVDIEEAFELMEYDDPEDADWEHKLLGEWVYEQFDLMPAEGDSFTYHDLQITVLEMKQNRIIKVGARILPRPIGRGGDK